MRRRASEAAPERTGLLRLVLCGLAVVALLCALPAAASAAFSGTNGKIAFATSRDGNYEVYSMNADGSGVTRLTHAPGYDGGPFYSYDGKKIVYRADHPKTPEDLALSIARTSRVERMRPRAWSSAS